MRGWVFLLTLYMVSAELTQCMEDLANIGAHLMNFTGTDPYSRMAQYSGRKLNDLGDYANCAELDYADYILIRVIPHQMAFLALCGSKNCTEEDYNQIYITLTSNNSNSQIRDLMSPSSLGSFKNTIDPFYNHTFKSEMKGASSSSLNIVYPQSEIEDNFSDLNSGAICMLVLCSIIVAISISGTVLDIMHEKKLEVYKKKNEISGSNIPMTSSVEEYTRLPDSFYASVEPVREPPFLVKLLMCFSLYTNAKKLFVSRSSEKMGERETMDIFNGVRVMSMGWVVYGHVFLIRIAYTVLSNPENVNDWLKDPKGIMIYGAFYAVDTFFWLSGFLMAYFFIMEYNTKGKMNWPYIYIHRFYRILPAFMFCLFLTWNFMKYIGNGPLWSRGDILNNDCKNYWWTNMLFLNNFIPDGDGSGCMGWTWYLANDMQFFLITPIVLYVYHKVSKAVGWLIILGLILTHMLTNALISDANNFSVGGLNALQQCYNKTYTKPYSRVGAYAIGIVFGLVYYSYKHHLKTKNTYDPFALSIARLFNIRPIRYISYILGLFLINYLIFIQYPANHDAAQSADMKDYWTQDERNAFHALSRIGFSTGLGLILLPVLMGHNRVVYEILGHSAWTPLARLSFCGYLIHYGLLYTILVSQPASTYMSDMTLFYDFIVCLVATYAAALPISLMLESPLMSIEKLMKGQGRPAAANQARRQVAKDKELL